MKPCTILGILVAALLAAPIHTAPYETRPDSAPQVSAVREEWVRDWKARNFEGLRALYDQDAVFLPAVGQSVRGPNAIGDYLKQVINSTYGDLIVQGSGEASGNLAYDAGSIQYIINDDPAAIAKGYYNSVVKGYYLMVLKQNSEGKWLIVHHALTEIADPVVKRQIR